MSNPVRPRGGRVKGAPLRALLEMIAASRSPADVARFLAGLRPADRDALRLDASSPGLGVLAGSWYPAPACGALVDAIWESLTERERIGYEARAAEHIMKATLSGVHRAVFRVVGSPSLMRDHGQTFWDRQFDTGRVRITDIGPRAQRHEYDEWSAHHPILCRITFSCVVPMFRAMGVIDPSIELERCCVSGSDHCSAIVRWRA